MGTSGRPSISKRQKEQVRADRARDKTAKRNQRKLDRQNPSSSSSNQDDTAPAQGQDQPPITGVDPAKPASG